MPHSNRSKIPTFDTRVEEISREANTIGAKSQDGNVSHLIVDLKGEVEKMREQVQNVE